MASISKFIWESPRARHSTAQQTPEPGLPSHTHSLVAGTVPRLGVKTGIPSLGMPVFTQSLGTGLVGLKFNSPY